MNDRARETVTVNRRLAPVILSYSLFYQGRDFPKGFHLEPRYVYDYELEYITFSEGGVLIVDGRQYELHEGDIVFRKPGQFVQGIMPYTCLMVCVDLLGNTGKDRYSYFFGEPQAFQALVGHSVIDLVPTVLSGLNSEKYRLLFDKLYAAFISSDDEADILQKIHLLQLIYQIVSDVRYKSSQAADPKGHYENLVKKSMQYMASHCQSNISLDALARQFQFSASHYHKVFKRVAGLTPNDYLTSVRLEKARDLLASSDYSICEIARRCGYENVSYFNYLFRKQIQMTPGEFRRRLNYI